jgi:NAD(P)H-flavin reductase
VHDLLLSVVSVRAETATTRIVRVSLRAADFHYRAGQAATIGPAGAAERVPYSIASAPAETARDGRLEFLIRIHEDGRWGTDFDLPRRGQPLRVRGPAGHFVLPHEIDAGRLLFIAGGTGIAPLRSMMRQLVLTGAHVPMRLLYSARTPGDFAYARELRALAREGRLDLHLTATRESTARWRGGRGRITREQLLPVVDGTDTLCFVCGPAAMVDDVPPILVSLGIPRTRIRLEEWT